MTDMADDLKQRLHELARNAAILQEDVINGKDPNIIHRVVIVTRDTVHALGDIMTYIQTVNTAIQSNLLRIQTTQEETQSQQKTQFRWLSGILITCTIAIVGSIIGVLV